MCDRKMMKQDSYDVKSLIGIFSRCIAKKCEKKTAMIMLFAEGCYLLDQVFSKSLM